MHPEKLLSRQNLENDLVLEFWDLSRPLTGDRWQVVVELKVAVDVTPETLPPESGSQAEQIIAALGPEVVFVKQEIRHFVPAGEVPELLAQLREQLFSSLGGYLGHPEFASRLIRKRFADHQEKQKMRQ